MPPAMHRSTALFVYVFWIYPLERHPCADLSHTDVMQTEDNIQIERVFEKSDARVPFQSITLLDSKIPSANPSSLAVRLFTIK
jgi:hypothetical protein